MNIYDLKMDSITGDAVAFSDFRGKALLIVNVASQCGLTPHYAGLQALHQTGKVTVLGFPCNQFGAQEPGTDAEICEFATSTYKADFPMFSKIDVNGKDTCALYEWLKRQQADADGSTNVKWNFAKFLISGEGQVLKRFEPQTTPEEIGEQLDTLL